MWPFKVISTKAAVMLVMAAVAAVFAGGYKTGTWHQKTIIAAAREAAVAEYVEAQAQAAREAAEVEADRKKREALQRKNSKIREKDIAKNPDNYGCVLTPDGVQVINDAFTGNPAE